MEALLKLENINPGTVLESLGIEPQGLNNETDNDEQAGTLISNSLAGLDYLVSERRYSHELLEGRAMLIDSTVPSWPIDGSIGTTNFSKDRLSP